MEQECAACEHPRRVELDAQLNAGEPTGRTAEVFNLPLEVVRAHRREHTARVIAGPDVSPRGLIDQFTQMATECDLRSQTPGIEHRDYVLLQAQRGRALKEIARITKAHEAPDPLTLLPHWEALRDRIMGALRSFPKAREAVEAAINQVRLEMK